MRNNASIKNNIDMKEYMKFKRTEKFLESLVFSKPMPHFVTSKHKIKNKNPFGLERIRHFLEKIDSPHKKNKYIHITGTSGKTSTSYFVTELMSGQGYRTGMYISPHITTLLERFMIDMNLPKAEDIIKLVDDTKSHINEDYEFTEFGSLSYFEYVLSLAMIYFHNKNVDYVTLEVGLGGRYDATNVIPNSDISIITNIGLDHTHILGNTKEAIAKDKIGIIKHGTPLITMEQEEHILDIFRKEAVKFDTEIQVLGKEFTVENIRNNGVKGIVFDYKSKENTFKDLCINMNGMYQAYNSSLAIRTLELIKEEKDCGKIDIDKLRASLLNTNIPARYEIINNDPVVILDGAHNPDKISHLVEALKMNYSKDEVIFVCGFTSGKNPPDMIKMMVDISSHFYLTRIFSGYRESEEPLYLKSLIKKYDNRIRTEIRLDPIDALYEALEVAKKNKKVICITGSLYLVSYLREEWYSEFDLIK